MKKYLNNKWCWVFLLLVTSYFSLQIGVEDFKIIELLQGNEHAMNVFLYSRLPRLISVLITGASLSIAGFIMQTLTQNKYVSPSTTGVMEFARFGIMISILVFGSATNFQKMLVAFISCFFGVLLFLQILKHTRVKDPTLAPLLGIMLGGIISSITTFFAFRYDIIQNISSWLLGSFSMVFKGNYELLYIGFVLMILAYFYADYFTITSMGEDFSKNLGINSKYYTYIGFLIVALICASVAVSVGSIPFVGLIIPNIISLLRGDHLRKNVFHMAFFGAFFVLLCDLASRIIIFPYEIPVSVIISIVGSILFFYVMKKRGAYVN